MTPELIVFGMLFFTVWLIDLVYTFDHWSQYWYLVTWRVLAMAFAIVIFIVAMTEAYP